MLVSFSSLSARAKRRKEVLLSCCFSHVDIATAAVRGAERLRKPLILTLDATAPLLYEPELIITSVLALARVAEIDIAVEVICEPKKQVIQRILDCGTTLITPKVATLNRVEAQALVTWTCNTALAFGVETFLYVHAPLRPHLGALAEETGVIGVRAALDRQVVNHRRVVPQEIQDVLEVVKVPVLADEAELTLSEMRKLAKSGVAAITIGRELEESFTAGLRTGLRNRSVSSPSRYLHPATRAVEETVANLIDHLTAHS